MASTGGGLGDPQAASSRPGAADPPMQTWSVQGRRPNYPIESVDNALKLLGLFRKQKPVRVSEASEVLGIARSTAHRLLAMLQYHGFVRQDPLTKAYLAGRGLIDLGLAAVQGLDVRALARPELERLCRELDETVHLVVLDGRSALHVDSVEGTRTLRVGARTGLAVPAHCTASGKALLAELPTDKLRSLIGDAKLEALTPRTITRLSDLERELERVREHGYATSFEESEPGLAAVAASLRGTELHSQAAIGVSAPSLRMTKRETQRVAAAVLEATRSLTERAAGPARA